MTRYMARPHQSGWQLYDRIRSEWCFGTWTILHATAERLAASWNAEYEKVMKS